MTLLAITWVAEIVTYILQRIGTVKGDPKIVVRSVLLATFILFIAAIILPVFFGSL